ncbi:hypothetical protein [Couchioplanes caeruleus]|uniref:Uncharacterized protein n=2 Tax=Couchioplanes caeruleus TaxID=56438 RepID=A0A1K0GMF6_9ACTN|nr:hypothetical protein [Couchioplanes caeruleus]OJF12260.1 hypothetical protein BG844_21710 [Couchioplanes caeruleus subsp. caeruleus]ROP33266.1 hypothetical protein EDD30_6236 [Couchioplanes caeruleus]
MTSTEAPTDLARVAEALRNEIKRKLNTLRLQLTDDLREVARAAEERSAQLARRLDDADGRLARLAEAHEELRRQAEAELRGARQAITRLTGEIHLIEGRLRLEHGVRPVDLDAVPPELEGLVAQVREAEEIRSGMLDDRTREAHHGALDAYAELRRLAAESRARALDASAVLARARPGRREFRRAAASYRHHWRRLGAQNAELAATRDTVAVAEKELAADLRQQEQFSTHRGAVAVAELTAHLRRRIDAAVETHALFPSWFTITELGHRPSAARAAVWCDAATRVALYRITYGITDSVSALGDPPEGGHRAQRYAQVRAALSELAE